MPCLGVPLRPLAAHNMHTLTSEPPPPPLLPPLVVACIKCVLLFEGSLYPVVILRYAARLECALPSPIPCLHRPLSLVVRLPCGTVSVPSYLGRRGAWIFRRLLRHQ